MGSQDFRPREGGVKIVFDVAAADADLITAEVAARGFKVDRYYRHGKQQRRGGDASGFVRLGAERAMHEFTDLEQDRIVEDFDALQQEAGFACLRIGTDIWTAGGDDPAGDREPRIPRPRSDVGGAAMRPGDWPRLIVRGTPPTVIANQVSLVVQLDDRSDAAFRRLAAGPDF